MCVVNQENWEVVKAKKVWGVSERWKKSLMSVEPSDLLVFYVIPKRLEGVFRVISKSYVDQTVIFKPIATEKIPPQD